MPAVYSAQEQVRVFGPPGFSVLPLIWAQETGALPGVDLKIELSPDHQRSLNLLATDQADFLITGLNVGAKAYTRGIGIQLVNVNTWAIDYVVARDPQIKKLGRSHWQASQLAAAGRTLGLPRAVSGEP